MIAFLDPNITINSRKFDGSLNRSWKCALVDRAEDLLTFYGEFEIDVDHADLGLIRRGTGSFEYYWLDRWYNIFQFHQPDGRLRNFYCNINMPPSFDNGVLEYVDLDIDVLVSTDLSYKILDVEEFERNKVLLGYPEEVQGQAGRSLNEVIRLIEQRSFPFNHLG